MRKPIVGALSTAFLLGMTVSAQAVSVVAPPETTPVVAMGSVKVTLDGNVRMRGYLQKDTVDDDGIDGAEGAPNSSSDTSGYDGRVQLGATVQAGDGVTGRILLQTGDSSSDTYGWGDGNSAGLNSGGSKQVDGSTDLSVLEGWLQYQPCNVGIKVGHMRLAEGNGLFFDHGGNSASGDDAAIIFGETVWGANVTGGIIKFEEGNSDDHRDDIDGYLGIYTQKINDAVSFGANLTYLHQDYDQTVDEGGMKFFNLGMDGAFKLGMVDLSADVEYQFGTLYENDGSDLGDEVDAKGYAMQVKATANLTNTFKVGGLVGYGSGDDGEDADEDGGFVNFLTDTIYQVVIPGYRLAIPGMSGRNTGLTNLTIFQVFTNVNTTCPATSKPLALEARLSKILLNETDNNDDLVNDAGDTQDDVGVELAGFATWKLSKNLAYKLELAYLFAGDAWDATADSPDPDNAYFMRHTLELNF